MKGIGALWRLRRLVNEQEIHILVLSSLTLQIILIFLAIFRKRSENKKLSFLLWISYLSADYVATIALGYLLYKGAPELRQSINTDLRSFWAPFLLIHLGGPDTITSYSLDDNKLWWRHFVGLVVQVSVASFVLLETHFGNRLWIATAAAFVIGVLKYGERTLCLRSASMDQLRDFEQTSEYERFMKKYGPVVDARTSAIKENEERPRKLPLFNAAVSADGEMNQIKNAYKFFRIVKLLAADLRPQYSDKEDCQSFFRELNHTQAFKVVEIELSFLYDTLHTKSIHVHSITGRLLRAFSLGTTIGTLLLFIFSSKEGYKEIDVKITYALLISAVGLEVISILLLILSDWTIVSLERIKLKKLARAVLAVVRFFFPNGKPYWSNSMYYYRLIAVCQREKPTMFNKMVKFLKMKNMWQHIIFLASENVSDEMKMFIFNHVKQKCTSAQELKSYKRLRDLRDSEQEIGRYPQLEGSMLQDFDESVILWHIATYICYHMNKSEFGHTNSLLGISMNISDYMLYLLVFQPDMLPAGIGKVQIKIMRALYKKTSAEATNLLQNSDLDRNTVDEEFCKIILQLVDTKSDRTGIDRSVSLLSDSCQLSKQLLSLNDDTRWRIISSVWMEMLGYAAVNCGAYSHNKQLNRGGEFLTHCWLLMLQMGIDY